MTAEGPALFLRARPFGERDAIATLLSAEHGLLRGLIKGAGQGSKKGSTIPQPLDDVTFTLLRRLPHQLGTLRVSTTQGRAHLWLHGRTGPLMVGWLTELLTRLLPEEHPYPELFPTLATFLQTFPSLPPHGLPTAMAQLERTLLDTIGYGPALEADPVPCAEGSPLCYVSPKSGRAVPQRVGAPYAAQLLPLPACWGGSEPNTTALTVTGHFLTLALPPKVKDLPARQALVTHVINQITPLPSAA